MKRLTVTVLIIGVWVLTPFIVAWSQQPSVSHGLIPAQTFQVASSDTTDFSQPESIKAKINELQNRIQAARQVDVEKEAKRLGIEAAEYQRLIDQMNAEQSAYEQLIKITEATRVAADKEALLRRSPATPNGSLIAEEPPYSLPFLDNLLDDLQSAEQRKIIAEMALLQSRKTIETTDTRIVELERKRRQLVERQEGKTDGDIAGPIQWQIKRLSQDVDLNRALLALEKAKYTKLELEDRLVAMERTLVKQKVQWVRQHPDKDDSALKAKLNSLEKRKTELNGLQKKLAADLSGAEAVWLKSLKQFGDQKEADTALETEKRLRAAEEWRNAYQTMIEQAYAMTGLIDQQEEYWRKRQSLIHSQEKIENLDQWDTKITRDLDQIRTNLNLQQKYQANIQSRIAGISKDIDANNLSAAVLTKMKHQLAALRQLADANLDFITELTETQKLGRRLLDETAVAGHRISFWKRLSQYRHLFDEIWNYEIIQIDNHSLTIRKIVFSLFILAAGIALERYFIRHMTQRLFRYTNISGTNAEAIQKVLLFSGYLLVFLFALRMVNIPLAAFAFLGGAIAIGVGFGAQNLINNFISGFIIMGERPISMGNLIEVDGVLGQVEEIGARCTRVRTGENIHILVPNSSFLEKNITNWTLSDQKIRTRISVGVVYGSPVRQVEALLLKAAGQNKRVIQFPEPFVIFRDFGDNALIFELYFWISITKVIERRIIESSIRFQIEEFFGEAGIVIAFPQRDVHIDAQKPLELHFVGDNPSTDLTR